MSKPSINLLDLLISLYADQKGVQITYELKGAGDETRKEANKRTADADTEVET